MAKVPAAIMIMVVASTFCRPMRSPSGPKTRPPSGRTTNAAAKVANEEMSWAPGEAPGKNTLPRVAAR
ncbi:hypothetical protein SFUMM280S_11520 [Streptomyces fumanus]